MTKVAVIQEPPVFLDLDRSIDRAVELIAKSAGEGCNLVVFPEAWLPGYHLCLALEARQGHGQDR